VAKTHFLLGLTALKLNKTQKAEASMERALQYFMGISYKSITEKAFLKCRQLSEELTKLAIEDQRYRSAMQIVQRYCKHLKAGFDVIKDDEEIKSLWKILYQA